MHDWLALVSASKEEFGGGGRQISKCEVTIIGGLHRRLALLDLEAEQPAFVEEHGLGKVRVLAYYRTLPADVIALEQR